MSAASSFVDMVPSRLNLGLVTFSGLTQVLVPPTTDHALVKSSLTRMQLGPRTAIGDAVLASLGSIAALRTEGRTPAPAAIVLMSDGMTTVGQANEVAGAAAVDAGVPVSTIAFGTDSGEVTVEGGDVIPVPVNREALRALAEQTGGQAFQAATEKELEKVYADIGSSVGYRTERREATAWFVGLGLAFALAAAAGSLAWSSRLP